ncbi:LGFP repeat-containing protein [Nocardia stercoris]|nr:hypothetical protein [Nocardia stercoris]
MITRRQYPSYVFTLGGATALAFGLLTGPHSATADPAADAAAIDARYAEYGGAGSLLGEPLGPATEIAGGAERDYRGGYIYYSPSTGAKVIYGDIAEKYRAMGGPASPLGFPINDESPATDGIGRFNDFAAPGGAAMYWKPDGGTWLVKGPVLTAWRASGDVTGPFGYPTSDVTGVNGTDSAQFAGPGGTEISWSPAAGLVTTPADLATNLPGYHVPGGGTEGAPAAPPAAAASTDNGINRWWGLPIGLAIAAAVGWLLSLIGKQLASEPLVGRKPATRTAEPEPRYRTTGDHVTRRPEAPPIPERPAPTYRSARPDLPTERSGREKPRITPESAEDVPFSYDHKTLGDQDR